LFFIYKVEKIMEIPEMESSPVKKSPKQEAPKPRRSYWIYILLLCIVIVGGLWWFKCGTECTTKPTPPVIQPTPPIVQDSYTELATLLCSDKFNWCQMSDTTPAKVESELRELITDSEQVRELVNSLNQDDTNIFSSLQILSPQISHRYLTEALTKFEPYDFKQIVIEQTKLSTVFVAFQSFANRIPSSETGPDSLVAPLSSFAYKVTKAFKETEEKLEKLSESKHSPFFSDSDLLKAKFLNKVVESGRDNKVFNVNSRVKVFTALCQLTDDNVVEAGYDSEGDLRDLCITPDPNKPTQQKCEVLGDTQTKNMAEAFLELREKLNQQLACEK